MVLADAEELWNNSREHQALDAVYKHFTDHVIFRNLKLVWFCKVLENWKAIVADISEDGNLYEVTYSGQNNDINVDEYTKTESVREKL